MARGKLDICSLGGVNGIALVATRFLDDKFDGSFSHGRTRLGTILRWGFTFVMINLFWVLFRSSSLSNALLFYHRLFQFQDCHLDTALIANIVPSLFKPIKKYFPFLGYCLPYIYLGGGVLISVLGKNTQELMRSFSPNIWNCLAMAVLLSCCILSFAGISSFLYWNF